MISAKYPDADVSQFARDGVAKAFCEKMRETKGAALKKVLNEGDNMWGVPGGVSASYLFPSSRQGSTSILRQTGEPTEEPGYEQPFFSHVGHGSLPSQQL